MNSYRKNFGAIQVGPKQRRKILVFGNGSGAPQEFETSSNFSMPMSQQSQPHLLNPAQKEQIKFELYNTSTNSWESLKAEYAGNILHAYVNNSPSFVTMLNYVSDEEEILFEPIVSNSYSQNNKCVKKRSKDKVVLILTPSYKQRPTEILLATYIEDYEVRNVDDGDQQIEGS